MFYMYIHIYLYLQTLFMKFVFTVGVFVGFHNCFVIIFHWGGLFILITFCVLTHKVGI